MEKALQIWNTIVYYASMLWGYIAEGASVVFADLSYYVQTAVMPALPSVLKLFSNRIVNIILFCAIAGFFVVMNVTTFCMFGSDKGKAKRKKERISEKKLIRMCFWGGAIGGFVGMLIFSHKTKKVKFFIIVPLLFLIQIILQSFIVGFLAFWAFFY